jgi:hypothetical protein
LGGGLGHVRTAATADGSIEMGDGTAGLENREELRSRCGILSLGGSRDDAQLRLEGTGTMVAALDRWR